MHIFSEKLELKNGIILKDRILPGPMEGILSPVFCKLLVEKKLVHSWITPFLRITTGVPNLATINKHINIFTQDGLSVIVQLMGTDCELMAQTALRMQDNFPIAGINLNYACPSKRTCAKGAGGGGLKTPKEIKKVLLRIRELCPNLSVSVKIRMGYETPEEIKEIMENLVESKVDFIFVHFRTVSEGYKKVDGRIERFRLAKSFSASIPLILSGDILTLEDAITVGKSNVGDGIIIARGLIKTPWLIEEVRAHFREEPYEVNHEKKAKGFFIEMLMLACREKQYWNSSYFAEIARYLFGVKSDVFVEYKKICREPPEFILKEIFGLSPE